MTWYTGLYTNIGEDWYTGLLWTNIIRLLETLVWLYERILLMMMTWYWLVLYANIVNEDDIVHWCFLYERILLMRMTSYAGFCFMNQYCYRGWLGTLVCTERIWTNIVTEDDLVHWFALWTNIVNEDETFALMKMTWYTGLYCIRKLLVRMTWYTGLYFMTEYC